jgi:uncharacterized membrane protein
VIGWSVVLAVCAAGLATAATAAADRLYLPVLPITNAAGLGYVLFLLLPVLATAGLALWAGQRRRFAVVAAIVVAIVVIALSWAGWIGLIVNECVLHDNRCSIDHIPRGALVIASVEVGW